MCAVVINVFVGSFFHFFFSAFSFAFSLYAMDAEAQFLFSPNKCFYFFPSHSLFLRFIPVFVLLSSYCCVQLLDEHRELCSYGQAHAP